jgi:hypothetical protein
MTVLIVIVALVWLSPVALVLAAALGCGLSPRFRLWCHDHLFGR